MQEKKGYVSFVLHAHLPFIHHPESDDYLEESWLYEAISETYLPLLRNFKKLVDEGVDFRITMSMKLNFEISRTDSVPTFPNDLGTYVKASEYDETEY